MGKLTLLTLMAIVGAVLSCQPPDCDTPDCGSCGKILQSYKDKCKHTIMSALNKNHP